MAGQQEAALNSLLARVAENVDGLVFRDGLEPLRSSAGFEGIDLPMGDDALGTVALPDTLRPGDDRVRFGWLYLRGTLTVGGESMPVLRCSCASRTMGPSGRAPPATGSPSADPWVASLAEDFRTAGVSVRTNYRVGSRIIDLVVGQGVSAIGIDAGPAAQVADPADRRLELRALGWRMMDLPHAQWVDRRAEAVTEILGQIAG